MHIVVRRITGVVITVIAEPSDSTETMKAKIEAKTGIIASKQRLIFAGTQLEDGRALSHYKIWKETVLHLIITA